MQKKYQIFISSTFRDLQEERQDAVKIILDLGHIPSGMEAFPATDTEQFNYIKKIIDECDYYVVITGSRYGSTGDDGISYTEKEYDYAVASGKFVLAFIHNNTDAIPLGKSDLDPLLQDKLETFRRKLSSGRLVKYWNSRDQLQAAIAVSLSKAFGSDPAIGWIRGDAVTDETLLKQINDLRIENEKLKKDADHGAEYNFGNLANFDDEFTIRYKYVLKGSGYNASANNASKTMSWREISLIVLRGFMTGSLGVSAALRTKMAESGRYLTFEINKEDEFTIRAQMEALSFISVNGGAFKVTEKGRHFLMNSTVVRSDV